MKQTEFESDLYLQKPDVYSVKYYLTNPLASLLFLSFYLPVYSLPTMDVNNTQVWIEQGWQVLEINVGCGLWGHSRSESCFKGNNSIPSAGWDHIMENNVISNNNQENVVCLRRLLMWNSIYPDLKNVSNKLHSYIRVTTVGNSIVYPVHMEVCINTWNTFLKKGKLHLIFI